MISQLSIYCTIVSLMFNLFVYPLGSNGMYLFGMFHGLFGIHVLKLDYMPIKRKKK